MKIKGDRKLFDRWAIISSIVLLLITIPMISVGYFDHNIVTGSLGLFLIMYFPLIMILTFPFQSHLWVITDSNVECYKRGKLKKTIEFSEIAAFTGGKYGIAQFSIYKIKANNLPARWDTMWYIKSEDFDKLFTPWAKWKAQQDDAENTNS